MRRECAAWSRARGQGADARAERLALGVERAAQLLDRRGLLEPSGLGSAAHARDARASSRRGSRPSCRAGNRPSTPAAIRSSAAVCVAIAASAAARFPPAPSAGGSPVRTRPARSPPGKGASPLGLLAHDQRHDVHLAIRYREALARRARAAAHARLSAVAARGGGARAAAPAPPVRLRPQVAAARSRRSASVRC